jgi:hypothetical protein
MTNVRSARRTAINYWLKAVRLPFDAAVHVLPANREVGNTAGLAIDRADATLRAAVGGLLNDSELLADAARRRAAVDERQRAVVLRQEAEEQQVAADAQLAKELDAAARLREEGEREAQARMEEADNERARRQQRAREEAAAQERVVEAAHQEQRAAETKEAKRARLALLEEQVPALDKEAAALTAKDEAQRLREAANAVKSARKRSN